VTDRQTDGRICRSIYSACKAVKSSASWANKNEHVQNTSVRSRRLRDMQYCHSFVTWTSRKLPAAQGQEIQILSVWDLRAEPQVGTSRRPRKLNTFAYLTANLTCNFSYLTFWICEKVSGPAILTDTKGMHGSIRHRSCIYC